MPANLENSSVATGLENVRRNWLNVCKEKTSQGYENSLPHFTDGERVVFYICLFETPMEHLNSIIFYTVLRSQNFLHV